MIIICHKYVRNPINQTYIQDWVAFLCSLPHNRLKSHDEPSFCALEFSISVQIFFFPFVVQTCLTINAISCSSFHLHHSTNYKRFDL